MQIDVLRIKLNEYVWKNPEGLDVIFGLDPELIINAVDGFSLLSNFQFL